MNSRRTNNKKDPCHQLPPAASRHTREAGRQESRYELQSPQIPNHTVPGFSHSRPGSYPKSHRNSEGDSLQGCGTSFLISGGRSLVLRSPATAQGNAPSFHKRPQECPQLSRGSTYNGEELLKQEVKSSAEI